MTEVFTAFIFTPKITFKNKTANGTDVMLRTIESVIFSRKSISSLLKKACVRKYPGTNKTKTEPNTTCNTVKTLILSYYLPSI